MQNNDSLSNGKFQEKIAIFLNEGHHLNDIILKKKD